MLKNYLKIAIRALARQKALAFINIAGLSIGLACFILFLTYAVNEFSYDRFQQQADRIYRVNVYWDGLPGREPGGEAAAFIPLGPALQQDFPDVEHAVRFEPDHGEKFVRVDNKVSLIHLSFADPAFFSMFSFPLLSGDSASALDQAQDIVLTREKALQLFGDVHVVGKTLEIQVEDKFEPFRVSAVAEDPPANSSVRFGMLGSLHYRENTGEWKESLNNWHRELGLIYTFVLLRKDSRLASEPQRMNAFRHKYYPDEAAELKKAGLWKGAGPLPLSFRLQPLRQIHTDLSIDGGDPAYLTNPKNVWILVGIAFGILLIACINFTTLAIGRSAGRAKEVGVRKVVGSSKQQLIYQFLMESLLLTVVSAGIGYLLAQAFLPFLGQLTGRELYFSFRQFPEMSWLLVGLVLLVGLLAGSYPALVLSGFNPVDVLKKKVRFGGSTLFIRSLVSFQFILSIGLILATVVILQQLQFLYTKDLGFDKENVIVLDAKGGADTKTVYPLLRRSLSQYPQVVGMTASEIGLGDRAGLMGDLYKFNGKDQDMIEYPVDSNYLRVMNMRLVAGRSFHAGLPEDTISSVIVNEAFARAVGLDPEAVIGQELKPGMGPGVSRRIVGVVKDFNYSSLTEGVRPQLFYQPASLDPANVFIRIGPGDPSFALGKITAAWKQVQPGFPLRYSFLDEKINRFYKSESKWSSIFGWAGGISIFLACLGLLGLAALAAVNRTNEIGIRRILGAPLSSIVYVISIDFVKLVGIAFVIASPVAWYFLHQWLQAYPYRIRIEWWVFAVTGTATILIALVTLGSQAIRAGMVNPVKSLRSE